MEVMLLAGVLSAFGAFFILMRVGVRFMARNALFLDILFTGSLIFFFFGTFSGMLAAALGGCILSILLWMTKLYVRKISRPI